MSLRETDAARAKNAAFVVEHDARAEVNGLRLVNFRFDEAARALAVIHGIFLQLAFAGLVANRAVERMIDEQKFQHAFAHLFHAGRRWCKFPCPAKSAWRRRWPGAATWRSSACRRDSTPACGPGRARACRIRPGTCGNCRRPAASDDSNNAAHPVVASAQAWIIVVGIGLPEIGSGIVFGTSISRPSTFTLIFSIARRGLGFSCGCG